MDREIGKKIRFLFGCILFLLITAFAFCELAFGLPISMPQANDEPVVSVKYHGTDIILDSDCHYILVSTYVFSNEGKEPISFDACYEATASYNGTALDRIYRDDDSVLEANDEIQPGTTVALQVGHAFSDFIPFNSATVRVKLTERFGGLNVIHQTEQKVSDIPVKEENPYCKVC